MPRNRAFREQAFTSTQRNRTDFQPEFIDQIVLEQRLDKLAAAINEDDATILLFELSDFLRNIAL